MIQVQEYEDFGAAGNALLNPVIWSDESLNGTPGVALHDHCLSIAEGRGVAVTQLCVANIAEVTRRWQSGGSDGGHADHLTLINSLLPGIDYGEGVLDRCQQFYELRQGGEALLRSPLVSDDNRNRIESVLDRLSAALNVNA